MKNKQKLVLEILRLIYSVDCNVKHEIVKHEIPLPSDDTALMLTASEFTNHGDTWMYFTIHVDRDVLVVDSHYNTHAACKEFIESGINKEVKAINSKDKERV